MTFIPDQTEAIEVPFFDDVTAENGWRGHATSKSVAALRSEVTAAFGELGALVIAFQSGTYQINEQKRQGFRIRYVVETGATMLPGQVEIAALPVRKEPKKQRTYKKRCEGALKQALYMFRDALVGLKSLRVLSPGTAPLLPWMIEPKSGETFSQLWNKTASGDMLLSPGEFVDGEFEEL